MVIKMNFLYNLQIVVELRSLKLQILNFEKRIDYELDDVFCFLNIIIEAGLFFVFTLNLPSLLSNSKIGFPIMFSV